MDIRTLVIAIGVCCVAVSKKSPCPGIAKTCTECFLADPICAWCSDEEMPRGEQRCSLSSVINTYCYRVESSSMFKKEVNIRKKKPLRRKRQISPQRIHVSLRKGASATVRFEILARKKTTVLKVRHTRALGVVLKSDCKGFKWKNKMATCQRVTSSPVKAYDCHCAKIALKTKNVSNAIFALRPSYIIKVTVDGNRKQSMKIKLKTICSCDCEKVEEIVPLSNLCYGRGDWACGVCACREGFYGNTCLCDASQVPPEEAAARCTAPGGNSICSGRGDCVCGQCECHTITAHTARKFTGQYCECDDYACDYYNGELCGGSERGVCKCSVCQCNKGYEGSACESFTGGDPCLSPISGTVCNGVGLCISGRCECIGGHGGDTCDGDCPGDDACPGICKSLKPCVECFAYSGGTLRAEECRERCGFMRQMAAFVEDVVIRERVGPVFRMCMFRDEGDCFFKFSYNFNVTNRPPIKIETTKMC